MKYCFLILSTLLIVSSCKKVDTPKSNEEMLREGKWKMELDPEHGIRVEKRKVSLLNVKSVDTLLTLNGGSNALLNDTTYILHYFGDCQADDYFVFREGITGSLNTGAVKCPQGEIQETDIQWGFTDNYTHMYLYNAGSLMLGNNSIKADVKEISESKVVLQYMTIDNTSSIPNKDTTYFTVTLKKF